MTRGWWDLPDEGNEDVERELAYRHHDAATLYKLLRTGENEAVRSAARTELSRRNEVLTRNNVPSVPVHHVAYPKYRSRRRHDPDEIVAFILVVVIMLALAWYLSG